MILLSGVVLILRGPSWWHESQVGLFFNSIHLWSVELFFFFMVLHLWGKFFMAAWRGKRALTWMTGVVTFAVSIGAAFTGYLSQQNFDSQWISTQAKDGLNSVGIGAFFNVLNFGQMLLWHVLLLPVVVARARSACTCSWCDGEAWSRPLPDRTGRHGGGPAPQPGPGRGHAPARGDRPMSQCAPHASRHPDLVRGGRACPTTAAWNGPKIRYDLVKEFVVALVVIALLDRGAGGDLLVARRPPRHHPPVGPGRPRATSWPRRSPSSTGRARRPPTARPTTPGPREKARRSGPSDCSAGPVSTSR